LTLLGGLALAQESQGLRYGQTIDDAVTTRLGDTWTFQGCAGDVLTVTMRSTEFDTFLELTGPLGPDPLVADDGDGGATDAQIAAFPLAASGLHTLTAAGRTILERGPYSLTLELSGTTQLPGPTPLLLAA